MMSSLILEPVFRVSRSLLIAVGRSRTTSDQLTFNREWPRRHLSHTCILRSPDKNDKSGQSKEDLIRDKTPVGKLAEQEEGRHPFQEKEPLKPHPG